MKSLEEADAMNWDQISGRWKIMRGKVREQWGKLTDDDLDQINGKREQLVGTIQRRYGQAKEEVEDQVSEWENGFDDDFAEVEGKQPPRQQFGSQTGSSGSGMGGTPGSSQRMGGSQDSSQTRNPPGGQQPGTQPGQGGTKGKGQQNPGSSRAREPSGR
jgi:uncharacterized protein YjbJ (UPF0337 family)